MTAFLTASQEETAAALELESDTLVRRKYLAQLQREITRRGVVDVLRRGVPHGKHQIDLFYGTPSPENDKAVVRHTLTPAITAPA